MFKVNVFEIKARLSEYLDRAARGERIVICRHNKPVAELRPVEEVRTQPRPIGPLPGRPGFEVPVSFFEPLPDDELDLWEGGTPGDSFAGRASSIKKTRAAKAAESTRGYRRTPKRSPSRKRS